jgi:mono/diheme cytochrome c family protein
LQIFPEKRAVLVKCAGVVLFTALAIAGAAVAHHKDDWPVPDEAKQKKNPVPVNDSTLAAGKATYTDRCSDCHGEKGDGKGPDADMYAPAPSDFTDADMMSDMTDGEIFWKISEGRRPMPSFKNRLTEEQRWQLVNYLRTFAPKSAPKK